MRGDDDGAELEAADVPLPRRPVAGAHEARDRSDAAARFVYAVAGGSPASAYSSKRFASVWYANSAFMHWRWFWAV